MSSCLDQTNQFNHVSNDYNDPIPEVDFNDETDDEDLYADEDTLSFIKSLKPVGNSFALVRKSNGDPTFLLYEGEDSDNDSDRRMTRSSTRKNQGSNSLLHNVSPTGLAKKRENYQNRLGSNCGSQSNRNRNRPRRKKKSRVDNKVGGNDHLGKVDKMVRNSAKKQKNDQDNGADTRKVAPNYNFRPRSQNPSVIKKVSNGGLSNKADRRARRLSGSRYRKGLAKKRKTNQGNGAEKGSSCIINVQGGQGNGAERARGSCIVEAQHDQGNGAEKEICSKIEALDDQDYGNSNRAYGIWLRDYSANIRDIENGNAETPSDSELEVLDKDPQCIEWKYTQLADSNILDASMEDDDLQYIGERSKPENPQFRSDVEDILGRPYDEEEYETLWLQVNSRKPMQGYRELRGNLKSYSKDAMGKSYLDEYLDLGRKLDTFENDLPRKLNVLRGFFYYLKNIASDGIFKPWLDKPCLAIVPRIK